MRTKIQKQNKEILCKLEGSLLILIILSIFSTLQVNAQTYQPQEQKLFYKGDSVYLDTHPDFQQRNFVLGWHWGNGYKLSSALDINEIMIWGGGRYDYNGLKVNYINPDSPPQIANNTYLVLNSPYIGYTWSENSMYRDSNGVQRNAPWSISHNIAYEYEPTYKVNLADPAAGGRWEPRQYDTTEYAFGFGTVRGYISSNQNDPNYDRLQLYPDSLSGEIVLAEPWVSTGLSSIAQRNPHTTDHEIIADTVVNIYNDPTPASWDTLSGAARIELLMKNTQTMRGEDWKGINFYISITLRRLDANDIGMHNDTILEIRMPWVSMDTLNDTTRQRGYIKFDSIPAPHYLDTFNLPRGVMRKLQYLPPKNRPITSIYITRAMLPRGNELKRDITISAFFVCDGDIFTPKLHNYGLKDFWGTNPFPYATRRQTIDSLKIEVIYRGNSAIGIDKIKIETPASRKMSWGYFDNGIKRKMQEDIDSLTTGPTGQRYIDDKIQLYRWYTVDEPPSRYWFAKHYLTLLCGKVFTFEGGSSSALLNKYTDPQYAYPQFAYPQYNYYTNPPENWFGTIGGVRILPATTPFFPRVQVPTWPPDMVPPFNSSKYNLDTTYKKQVDSIFNVLQHKTLMWGVGNSYDYAPGEKEYNWGQAPDSIRLKRVKQSNYETASYIPGECEYNHFNFFKDSSISPMEYKFKGPGVLFSFESSEYRDYYISAHNRYLFDNKKWWGQIWIEQHFILDSNRTYTQIDANYTRVLTGEEFRYAANSILLHGAKGFVIDGSDEQLRDNIFLLKLHHGQELVESLGYNNDLSWTFLNKEEIGGDFLSLTDANERLRQFIQIDTVAHYLNIDSSRYYVGRKSMRREFKKISEWVRYNDSILMELKLQATMYKGFQRFYTQDPKYTTDNIIESIVNINSIKTRPIDRVDIYNQPYYEQHFRLDSGFYSITLLKDTITNLAYLGVLNTRTGPHIVLDPTDAGGSSDSIIFLSTAELEDSINHNSEKWEKYYWKRLGTREIRIPINCDPNYVGGYYIFASELGAKDAEFRNNNFWLDNKYHHWIDTVIKPREWLISKHLPGEGKLIKMDIHNLAESTLTFADSTEFDSTSTVRDTCTGCYWAKRHLRIEETPMDTGGCWNVTITNDAKCDYTILNLLIEQISDDFSRFEFDNDTNFKTITINSKQYFYKEIILDGDSSYSFRFCGDPATSYSYQYRIGTVITDTVVGESGLTITNNIYACYSPLTGIITKGSCCDSITVQRAQWVDKMSPGCGVVTSYDYVTYPRGGNRYIECKFDYIINLNSNKCDIMSVNLKRIRMKDSVSLDTTYNFQGKDTLTMHITLPCDTVGYGDYIYHLQFKDSTDSIKCDQITLEKCRCSTWPSTLKIQTNENQDTWSAIISAEDTTSSDLMVYGILARDANNPNNIYYCEQKQAGLEPPFDLSIPFVLDTITVPLDSSIHVEVYFMDADSIVIGYARYDSTIYSNHVYISDLSVVPNPTNQILGIHYHVLEPVEVNVSVWDSFGNKMHDFGTSYHQIGDYDVSLDIGSYINGSYYVSTTARGDVQSVQFVIQR